jgi:hypothetical protein
MVIDEVERLRVRVRRATVKTGKKRLELNFIDTPQNGLTVLGYTKIVPNQIFIYYSVKSCGYKNIS